MRIEIVKFMYCDEPNPRTKYVLVDDKCLFHHNEIMEESYSLKKIKEYVKKERKLLIIEFNKKLKELDNIEGL